MREVKDSGRFIFGRDAPETYIDDIDSNPSKPRNMLNDTRDTESMSPDRLYTYSMGISEIRANNNTYEESNAFVTKPIQVHENVLQISLDSVEEHPVFDEISGRANDRQTSVEYYVSMQSNPNLADWIPILPEQTEHIKSERLFFDGVNATTLFPFQISTVEVFRDGIRLKEEDYYILNNQQVQLTTINRDVIYTVNYTPNTFVKNPYLIEVNDYKYNTTRMTEEFPQGTDVNKTITLSHVPYIDREKIIQEENYNPSTSDYKPIEVDIVSSRIQGPNGTLVNYVPSYKMREGEPYMNNKTLYLDNSWSDMKRYNLEEGYLGIDYYQYKNKITLAEHINIPMIIENEKETPGTGTIRVSYDALATEFRLKVILRRNTQKEITTTPKLKEYKLNFKATR